MTILRRRVFVNPVFTSVQLSPSSVERKIPSSQVPANMSPLEFRARVVTELIAEPVINSAQLSPLSVERKIPPLNVPANISLLAFIAKAETLPPRGPLV